MKSWQQMTRVRFTNPYSTTRCTFLLLCISILIYYTPTNALLYYNSLKVFTLNHLKCPYMFRSLDHPQGAHLVPCQSYMLRVNYFIKCFGDAAAYRLYVYILYLLQGGRSVDLAARDTTYTHTNDMLTHHQNV